MTLGFSVFKRSLRWEGIVKTSRTPCIHIFSYIMFVHYIINIPHASRYILTSIVITYITYITLLFCISTPEWQDYETLDNGDNLEGRSIRYF